MALSKPGPAGCSTPPRRHAFVVGVLSLAFVFGNRASASEAIPGYQWLGDQLAGFAFGGAGFAFAAQTNVSVTSLGFGGSALADEPYQVSLWDTNGTQLAAATVSTNSPLRNGTYYEPIQRLVLALGQTYYISAVGTDGGGWNGSVLSSSGAGLNGTFSVAPDLSYLASALGTNLGGIFPLSQEANTLLLVGANFEYATRPIIILSEVALAGGEARVDFSVTGGPAPLFLLLEAAQAGGPWLTNANAILTTNVPDRQFTFTSSQQGQVRFFRVLAP